MLKSKAVILLVCSSLFVVSGCVTLPWNKTTEVKKTKKHARLKKAKLPVASGAVLTEEEKYHLRQWTHAATLAEDAGDSEMAIHYYSKVLEYFPDTKEGVKAEKKLEILDK